MSSRARPTDGFEAFRSRLVRLWRSDAELIVERSTGSTNDVALGRLATGPVVVVAWEQTAGRGRRGRDWASAAGAGVWASIGLPVGSRAMLELLPLLAPVVLARSLRALGVDALGLKWPNDLVVEGRKLGGVMVRAISRGDGPAAAVIGLGVNLERPDAERLERPAVGVTELVDPAPELAVMAHALTAPLVEELGSRRPAGAVAAEYRSLSVHRPGEPLRCRTAAETIAGDFLGIDDRGHLRLRVAAGVRQIASGELVEG